MAAGANPLVDDIDPTWQRLGRLALWCRAGRLADAQLEPQAWRREQDCPVIATLLLAAMLARQDELDDALAVLQAVGRDQREDDPAVGQLLVSVLTKADLIDSARRAARKLHDTHGHDPAVRHWLKQMQVPGQQQLPSVTDTRVEHLATELIERPQVITSLVAVAMLWKTEDDITLLRRAVNLAGRDLTKPDQQLMICRALAELEGDQDDARRWAYRGLKFDPFCAELALVLGRIEDDDAVGPPATAVLARLVDEHPDYPDLRAALVSCK